MEAANAPLIPSDLDETIQAKVSRVSAPHPDDAIDHDKLMARLQPLLDLNASLTGKFCTSPGSQG